MNKMSLQQAIILYRQAYRKFHGYEPTINPAMTVRELIGHAHQWRKLYHEHRA